MTIETFDCAIGSTTSEITETELRNVNCITLTTTDVTTRSITSTRMTLCIRDTLMLVGTF